MLGPRCPGWPKNGTIFVCLTDRSKIHADGYRHTAWLKKLAPFLYASTLPNINRFSQLFHLQNQEKICNNTITKAIPPHLKCVATLPCEMSSVLKSTIENWTTSEVKRYTLIVTKFFIKKTKLLKNTDQLPMISVTRHRQKNN